MLIAMRNHAPMLSPVSIAAFSAGLAPTSGVSANVRPVRSVSPPPREIGSQLTPTGAAPPVRDAPDRALPRGSLLDLSV